MKKIKLIVLLIFLLICFYITFFIKGSFETNLVSTILPKSIDNYENIMSIANKSASVIKVVFEGGQNQQEEFLSKIDKDVFDVNNIDISKYIDVYKKSRGNYLSPDERKLLANKEYDVIYNKAIEQLYSPISLQILPFESDPYFLLSDFLQSNNIVHNEDTDKIATELVIRQENGLSPDVINKEIAKLIKLQKTLQSENEKIYLSGVPIHSYYTSQNAIISINIITLLSVLLILFITYFYFRNLKIVFPIAMSIFTGILAGGCAVKLCFSSFQVVTLLFSTAIIGLGLDYSYHYFFSEDKNKTFIKNLTYSMLTTIIPFALLYLTGIELLKQIAVFSIFALVAVYIFVLVYYPEIKISSPKKYIKTNPKLLKISLCIICLISLCGYFKLNFSDSLESFYVPNKKLMQAEKIYNQVKGLGSNIQFISVKGGNREEISETQEDIISDLKSQNIDCISLSRFFPSEKRQKENLQLVQDLYKNNLNKFKEYLSPKQINELKTDKSEIIKAPEIKEFTLDKNTSLMYVYSSESISLKTPNAKIINVKSDIEKYLKEYRYNLFKIFPVMLIAVFALLSIIFGIRRGMKTALPPIIGMFASIGLSSLFLGEMNLFSIIALFLVLGFTIDYSVFKSENVEKNEDAVFVSAFTSAFSFLLLSFTSFQLISSIALVLSFGIIVSYISGCVIFRKGE